MEQIKLVITIWPDAAMATQSGNVLLSGEGQLLRSVRLYVYLLSVLLCILTPICLPFNERQTDGLSVCLPVCLSVCLFASRYFWVYIGMSVCFSFCLFVYLSIRLAVSLSKVVLVIFNIYGIFCNGSLKEFCDVWIAGG